MPEFYKYNPANGVPKLLSAEVMNDEYVQVELQGVNSRFDAGRIDQRDRFSVKRFRVTEAGIDPDGYAYIEIRTSDPDILKVIYLRMRDMTTISNLIDSLGEAPPGEFLYDDFLVPYALTNDNQISPNGKWRMLYHGVNPTDPLDIGQCGVRVPAGGEFGGVMYAYPYQNENAGVDTAASQVLTTQAFEDLDFTFSMRTLQQLRTPTPEVWETVWVMWHFNTADGTFFHHYYLALKSDGTIELGRKDNTTEAEEQTFLSTTATFTWALGEFNKVRITFFYKTYKFRIILFIIIKVTN